MFLSTHPPRPLGTVILFQLTQGVTCPSFLPLQRNLKQIRLICSSVPIGIHDRDIYCRPVNAFTTHIPCQQENVDYVRQIELIVEKSNEKLDFNLVHDQYCDQHDQWVYVHQ